MRSDAKNQAFLIHFDKEVELLQDLTPSTKKLDDALSLLQTPELEDARQAQGGQRGEHRRTGKLLYDAVFLASDALMRKQQGRKALIVLSDGVDRGSREPLQGAIDAAQRANTTVYSILFEDEQPYRNGHRHGGLAGGGGRYPQREERPDGGKILDRISGETGGHVFEVSKKDSVDQIYAEIEQELRDEYLLGYMPDKSQSDNRPTKCMSARPKRISRVRPATAISPHPSPRHLPRNSPWAGSANLGKECVGK